MRFVMGLLLGFGIGFAAAILFAPERRKEGEGRWPGAGGQKEEEAAAGGNHRGAAGLQQFIRSVRERIDEAFAEAKEASAEAEREMRSRYHKVVGRGEEKAAQ